MNYPDSPEGHGAAKYDAELGRFTAPDPLWEQYYAWSPYAYAAGNPVSLLDRNGKFVEDETGSAKIFIEEGKKYVIANDGTKFELKSSKMNCIGYAFAYCNGKGAKAWSIDEGRETRFYDFDPSKVDALLKAEGYTEPKIMEDESELEPGDLILYQKDGQWFHAGVYSFKKDGIIITSEVKDLGGSKWSNNKNFEEALKPYHKAPKQAEDAIINIYYSRQKK